MDFRNPFTLAPVTPAGAEEHEPQEKKAEERTVRMPDV
jgi:hypothetical protein